MLSFSLVLKSLCGMAGECYDTIGHESEYMERHSVSKAHRFSTRLCGLW